MILYAQILQRQVAPDFKKNLQVLASIHGVYFRTEDAFGFYLFLYVYNSSETIVKAHWENFYFKIKKNCCSLMKSVYYVDQNRNNRYHYKKITFFLH